MMKKKGLSIFMIMLSIIMLCVSVVIVYSASSHSVKGTMNVTYVANNVGATVSAKFQRAGDGSATNLTTTGADATSLTFNISDTSPGDGSLYYTSTINIDDDHPYVLFTYTFHNDATSGASPFYITITSNTSTNAGAFTTYYYSNTAGYTVSSDGLTAIATTIQNAKKTTVEALGTVTANANSNTYVYVLVKITTLTGDATYNSGRAGSITFNLSHTSA